LLCLDGFVEEAGVDVRDGDVGGVAVVVAKGGDVVGVVLLL